MARSSAWGDLLSRALEPPWDPALALFRFAGAWAPPPHRIAAGWGAFEDAELRGALLLERLGGVAMLDGPVMVAPPGIEPEAVLDAADRLVGECLARAGALGVDTIFTRPQGLDRIWVREGFIPVPEAELPRALRDRPGVGLYGWRGGSALWSAAGRGAVRTPRSER